MSVTFNPSDIVSNQGQPTLPKSSTPASAPVTFKAGDIISNQGQSTPPAKSKGPSGYAADSGAQPNPDIAAGISEGGHDIVRAVDSAVNVPLHPLSTIAHVAGSAWDNLPPVQLANSTKQLLPVIDAYEKARSGGASIRDAIKISDDVARQHTQNISAVQPVVDAFRANPTRETARALTDAVALAASLFVPGLTESASETEAAGAAARIPEAAAPEAADTSSWWTRNNPFRKPLASPKALGTSEAQAPAQAAVRAAVGAADTGAPLVNATDATTIADKPIADLAVKEKAAYKQVDDTVGFDLKAEKIQLGNDQYKLKQLGNTEADAAQRVKLNEAIQDSTQRIKIAEAKLSAAKIDPAAADALHASRMANWDFKKLLVKTTKANGTDVNALLEGSKNLRFVTRNGRTVDRLAQAFGQGDAQAGKVAADKYMSELAAAQKTGQAFMDARTLRNVLLKVAGYGTGLEILRAVSTPTPAP